jgi:hypothetical protein
MRIVKFLAAILVLVVVIGSVSMRVSFAEPPDDPAPAAGNAPGQGVNDQAGGVQAADAPGGGDSGPVDIAPFSSAKKVIEGSLSENLKRDKGLKFFEVSFADKDIATGWLPWIIKNLSILMGGLFFIMFSYAGLTLFIKGDDPEEIGKSLKMITYSIVGLVVAALSYAIVGNILNLF